MKCRLNNKTYYNHNYRSDQSLYEITYDDHIDRLTHSLLLSLLLHLIRVAKKDRVNDACALSF